MHIEEGISGHLHSQEYLRSMRTQEDGASEYELLSQSSLHKKDRQKINQHQKVLTFLEQNSFQLGMSPKPSESRGLIKLIATIKWKSSDVLKELTNGNECRTFKFCDLDGFRLCNSGYHQHFY